MTLNGFMAHYGRSSEFFFVENVSFGAHRYDKLAEAKPILSVTKM